MLKFKKTLLLFLFLPAFITDAISQSNSLRIMSYNIRLDAKSDEENGWGWSKRKQPLCDLIKLVDPALLGLQEVVFNQLQDIATQLPNYGWVGNGRDDGKNAGEFSPIFYNKEKFELLDHGMFWLSETPDVKGSKGWDAALPRICTWAKLRNKLDNKELYYFNTHFDHIGKKARAESANLIVKKIVELAGSKLFVFNGDFNSPPSEAAYQNILSYEFSGEKSKFKFKDASLSATKVNFGPSYTFTGFDTDYAKETIQKIDYIFVPEPVTVVNYYTLPVSLDKKYVSDHCPIFTDIAY